MSWPAPVLYGHSTVYITEHNITGSQCGNVDSLKDTKYMAFFNVGLVLIFIIVFVTLVVLYFLIWRVVMKHKPLAERSAPATKVKEASSSQTSDNHEYLKMTSSSVASPPEQTCSSIIVDEASSGTNEVGKSNLSEFQSISLSASLHITSPGAIVKHIDKVSDAVSGNKTATSDKVKMVQTNGIVNNATQKKIGKKINAAKKTTFIFLLIAVLMFASYVPHLVMKIIMFLNTDLVPNMSYTGRLLYKTFIWCFFINNMANPFVYGFFDKQFMTQVKILYRKIPALWRRT